MAKITQPNLPADLPEDWNNSQYVSADGLVAGLTAKHGYNYLMEQVNTAQTAVNTLAEQTQTEVSNLERGKANATAQRTGTTVAITGPEDAVTVTFLAPANWTEGDTYTYNGQTITLTDLNGNPVKNGWKQGAPVTLSISGSTAYFAAGASGDFLPLDGGTMTGPAVGAPGAIAVPQFRNVQYGTEALTPGVSLLPQGTLYITPEANAGGFVPQIIVTAPTGSTVTAALGDKVYTAQEQDGKWTIDVPSYGTYTVTAALAEQKATAEVTVTAVQQYPVTLACAAIYGAEWDGTSTTVWSRTDLAADFPNPTPYVQGQSSYGSPFDKIMPWSGMVRVTDSVAGELVAIPKFWFKWTKSGSRLKLQIADKPVEGFHVSPAHADRGDGKGERDIVYIGRYHCGADWKSKTRVMPKASITSSAARTGIHSLGEAIWQSDIQIRMTIWMLYLVEFADWNSQKTIGKGCGDNSATGNMGYTDSMPYHTGTTQSSRDSYGLGTQYRNIEGLWDNVYDWGDGCYYNDSGLNIIMNPNKFSDTTGGIAVGVPVGGWPSAFAVATKSGLEWCIYPTAKGGSETTYSSDYWDFSASYMCLYFGGNYYRNGNQGLFCVYYNPVSLASAVIGCRLQKLP